MSSFAFPAFERAQQQHMAFDQTAEQLYQSVRDAIHASSHACIGPSDAETLAAASKSSTVNGTTEPSAPPLPKITKRVNARLQLAAALIEADNESILAKAQFWHIYHPPQAHDFVHPPPPPQPALASQSAIFAPFREGATTAVKRHVRTWSAATGLSRLLDAENDGKRPSVDFLGVALPTDQRARSRAGSSVTGLNAAGTSRNRSDSLFSNATTSVAGRTSKLGSRPASVLEAAAEADTAAATEDVLSDWGVDKFLSKDERERIAAGQRNRAQSLAGSARARSSIDQMAPSLTGRRSIDTDRNLPSDRPAVVRASSEIVGASSSAAGGTADPKLELLARIKLYRERQENLPPSEWDGPGPTATKDEVVEHIIASSDGNKRSSLRQASQELEKPPESSTMVNGVDQESNTAAPAAAESIMDRPRPSSRADSTTSSAFPSTPLANGAVIDPASQSSQADAQVVTTPSHEAGKVEGFPADQAHTMTTPRMPTADFPNPFDQQTPTASQSMVGVGSFPRSQSRRNSYLGDPSFFPDGDPVSQPNQAQQRASMSFMPPHATSGSAPFGQQQMSGRGWATDQFAEHDLGLGPSPFAAALLAASPSMNGLSDSRCHDTSPGNAASPAIDFNSLTTRQLQNVARNSTFPSHLGINRDLLAEEELHQADEHLLENEFGQTPKRKRQSSYDITALAQDLAKTGGENFEIQLGEGAAPDLSSANWGKPRKKWFRLSMMMDAKGRPAKPKRTDGAEGDGESDAEALDVPVAGADPLPIAGQSAGDSANMTGAVLPAQTEDMHDIDDDYVSPPRRGPLRPLGLAARTPQTIVMPQPLQGTEFAPKLRLKDADTTAPASKRHSLHVPDGFVLHNSRGDLPPMRSLVVHSANGPQPMFAAKMGNKKQQQQQPAPRLKAVEVGRTVQVPAAAPRGIGRRAAAPTTALFRNHLVQNEDEREGWGWEAGTRVDDVFHPDQVDDSDDDDKPLADIKKQSRSAKRAAKRLVKEKRKRKAARRVRRAKREEALKEGKSFKEAGVDELSPDEDLDLSSTSTEEEVTGSETDSDLWASDDDKRWVDDSKPAGKLYGKSLLDLATERNQVRKSKARFYGQVQHEDGEVAELQIDGDGDRSALQRPAGSVFDDDASVAPSVARTFRDKPVGFNDTRERMEAVFGADQVWAREMAKRRDDEAREAEQARQKADLEAAAQQQREAEAKARKERGLFTLGRKGKKSNSAQHLGISNGSAIPSTASFAGSNVDVSSITPSQKALHEEEEVESQTLAMGQSPLVPPVLALDLDEDSNARDQAQSGRRSLNLLAGEEAAAQEWLIHSDVEPEQNDDQGPESSDDDLPLAQVKKNVASRPVSFAAGLSLNPARSGDADSSDEELPLAALKQKRIRQSAMLGGGKLDLDFASLHQSLDRDAGAEPAVISSPRPGSLPETTSVAYDDFKAPFSQPAAVKAAQLMEDDDSDEDLPLGQRHPGGNAALLAMRTALENQKRAEKEARQAAKAQKRAAKLARQVSTDDVDAAADAEQSRVDGDADQEDDGSEEEEDSDDDQPLGYVHPQAAIIAEQAELIRQLQSEREQQQQQQQQQPSRFGGMSPSGSAIMSPSGVDMRSSVMLHRMSGVPSMMGGMAMGMADPRHSMIGMPTNGSMMGMPQFDGLPTSGAGLPFSMPMSTPMQMGIPMAPGSQIGVPNAMQSGAMSPAMTMPMMAASPQMGATMTPNPIAMMLDPKASSIHNWRTQVPPDAPATLTPPSGASTVNSAR
ncbi:hypothetical protein PSEUBRA_000883 [Kalmanozyma brasiliensis GHG001]|uniref:uncharacterized protein n=1 Tax=Kalmanozyma brasiliensis (strain GHG001) TaxID=1365824 RepID=UPI001CEA7C46|nr:uncharacterized protein PSEUBRA_000883 [Kalmanozyma brasiliensis GHG001]EST09294.2 hypothetical protein PSEUBRA_000883 [Kalmanozyma brasiliensis GHG001]